MLLERFINKFIPYGINKDIVELSHAKNFVGVCIISLVASLFYAGLYYYLHYYKATYAVILAEIIMLSSLLILKHFGSLIHAANVFIISLTCLLIWLTYHLGGLYSATAYWFILPPLTATFIAGTRSGYVWSIICLVITSTFYLLQYIKYVFPIIPINDPLLLQYIAICGLNVVIICMAYFYEQGKKDSLEKLRYIAYHDTTTSLPNRLAYEEFLEIISKKSHESFSICSICIDKMQRINDIFGKKIGNLLLTEIAQRIKRHILNTDMIALISKDEFKVVIEHSGDSGVIKEIAHILLLALKIPYHIKNHEIRITISIGIAIYPTNTNNIVLMDRYADIAVARAKDLGGDNHQFFTETLAGQELLLADIEKNLPYALVRNELYLNFQLLFDAQDTKRIVSLEALLRWNNKDIGDIPSSVFIPIAERSGIINQLGEWALKAACQQYMKWLDLHLVDNRISLAVNISVHQLYDENFLNTIDRILNETGIHPRNLELEVTETVIISDLSHAASILHELNKMGIRTVIDDFGAGYTSLSYLAQLPVSVIKIDKSLVDNMLSNSSNSAIIESLIDLAHKMNLKVVVEGIETIEQLNFIRKIHCDYAQGFYLSKPLDIINTQKILAKK